MERGVTRAAANKRIRQEALRDQLSNQGHVQHLIDLVGKVEDLAGVDLDAIEVSRLRLAMDNRRYLIDKYLPSIKQSEIDLTATEMDAEQLLERERIAQGIIDKYEP